MCPFVDKIFQIMWSTEGNDKDSLSGEIVSNYYPKGDSVQWT